MWCLRRLLHLEVGGCHGFQAKPKGVVPLKPLESRGVSSAWLPQSPARPQVAALSCPTPTPSSLRCTSTSMDGATRPSSSSVPSSSSSWPSPCYSPCSLSALSGGTPSSSAATRAPAATWPTTSPPRPCTPRTCTSGSSSCTQHSSASGGATTWWPSCWACAPWARRPPSTGTRCASGPASCPRPSGTRSSSGWPSCSGPAGTGSARRRHRPLPRTWRGGSCGGRTTWWRW
mmetsp:Transcript_14212/g.22409  ORF Transcript_14212/g.22409 Transcript_14212/m.22409 type:complete len:231 (+) Transcript_14212:306-998(+)